MAAVKSLSDMDRMDYFTYRDRVYRVTEFEVDPATNSLLYVHCKNVLFKMDGIWHECEQRSERFNPYCDVEPCHVLPTSEKLWLAHDMVDHRRALFTNVGKAKDWLARSDESAWHKTPEGVHVYVGEGLATITNIGILS